jgi:hypothetical protein
MKKFLGVVKVTTFAATLALMGIGMFSSDAKAQTITCSLEADNCRFTNDSGSIRLRLVSIEIE